MSDLQTQPPPRATSDNTGDGGAEALQKLHKMSRTAGLGSGDYAAVNGVSVAAVLFGVASALVVLDAIFLLVPVLAIVLAAIAWTQIKHSAGTQTGKGLCIAAILLALGCTAFLGSKQLLAYLEERRNIGDVANVVEQLGNDLAASNYDAAYARFSDDFRARVDKSEFTSKFEQFQGFFGKIQGMRWNQRILFDVDNKTNDPMASTMAVIELPKDRTREEMHFRKINGQWFIDDLPVAFPKPVKLVPGPGKAGPIAPR